MSVQSEIDRIKAVKEDIRAAIVEQGQSVPATAPLSSYGDKIRAIQAGVDTSDATAAAGDILSGKTAYAKGTKVTGTIASRTAGNLTASGATVTVPAGYYPSQVSKSVASATRAAPSITVSSAGQITASVTQESAGYMNAGTKSATRQLATQAGQTVTPTTYEQTAVASGRYTTGDVKVAGDANLIAANIKKGVSIFGVEGTVEPATARTVMLGYVGAPVPLQIVYSPDNKTLKEEKFGQGSSRVAVTVNAIGAVYFYIKSGSYGFKAQDGLIRNCDYMFLSDAKAFVVMPTAAQDCQFYVNVG